MKVYLHIGPFKTGTTDFQEYMWRHRREYAKQGVLYPKTGVVSGNWGHRHLKLARCKKPALWDSLMNESLAAGPAEKVVVSAERFWSTLSDAIPLIKEKLSAAEVNIVVVVRKEGDLARSMYLQTVKSRFLVMKNKQARGVESFESWFERNAQRFCYPTVLAKWIEEFGENSVRYVPYRKESDFDVVEAICKELAIPYYSARDRHRKNSSIGGAGARWVLLSSRLGPVAAYYSVKALRWLERWFPRLAKTDPTGYDKKAVEEYYSVCRARYAGQFPALDATLKLVNEAREKTI